MNSAKTAHAIERREAYCGKWVKFKYVDFKNNDKIIKNYEYCERTTRKGDLDGVEVIGIIKYPESKQEDKVVIIANYRPPVDKYVLEMPAGLCDSPDDPMGDGLRELEEETGFIGEKVLKTIPM